MKILQLTFTYGNNFGGMMQAYALNKVLSDMGNDCYFLPFYPKPFELPKQQLSAKGKILELFRRYKHRNYTKEWFSEFNHFLYERCQFAPYVDLNALASIDKEYDMFLVGSDQVWSVQNYKNEYCLLKWVSEQSKRCSYAASLGNYSIRMNNDPVLDAIRNFGSISFREEIDYCDAKRNGISCRLDIDPTFLIDRTEWEKLVKSNYRYLENYVTLFGYDNKSFKFAKAYAKKHKKKLVIVNYFGNRVFPGIGILNPPSPVDLLSVIRYSNCIVTHSYHVFIVSLNLNKRVFYSKINNDKVSERFATVVHHFELPNLETEAENMEIGVDWNRFNSRLAELRWDSMEYLKGITK